MQTQDPRNDHWASVALLSILACLFASRGFAQERPLERAFTAGAVAAYRVQVTLRSEVEGQQTVEIGAKTYVKPFSRWAEARLSWRTAQRVVAVGTDGAAEMEETLDDFGGAETSGSADDEETRKLLEAVQQTLEQFKSVRAFHYRVSRAGHLSALNPNTLPPLGEASPTVLTLWLLRALRPEVALPARPVRFGQSWREPRSAQLPNWEDVGGSESGEWLEEARSGEPAARLHLTQQISARVASGAEKPPEGVAQARFHGESLSTVSLLDGRLLTATRSATREITWTLAPVEGLPEAPKFRGRLSAEVRIEGRQ